MAYEVRAKTGESVFRCGGDGKRGAHELLDLGHIDDVSVRDWVPAPVVGPSQCCRRARNGPGHLEDTCWGAHQACRSLLGAVLPAASLVRPPAAPSWPACDDA